MARWDSRGRMRPPRMVGQIRITTSGHMGLLSSIRERVSDAILGGHSRAVAYGSSIHHGVSAWLGRASTYSRRKALTKSVTGWVAIGVNANTKRVSRFPPYVERVGQDSSGKITRIQDQRHPLSELLWRPNRHMTGSRLMAVTAGHLDTVGEAFWIIQRDERTGLPAELWPVRPDWMTEVPDEKQFLLGWLYRPPSVPDGIPFDVEDVVHISWPSLTNPYRGASRIEQQAVAVDAHAAIQVYGRSIVQSGGRVDLHLETNADTSEKLKKARELFAGQYEQARKKDRILATGAGMKVTALNLRPKDLEFIGLAKMTREQILIALGTPPEVVGVRDSGSGRSTADDAYRSWNRDTIEPTISLIAESVAHRLLPQYDQPPGRDQWLEIGFENPVPEDEEAKARLDEILVRSNIKSVNDARSARGLEPWEGFDEPWVSAGLLPASVAKAQAEAQAAMWGAGTTPDDPDPEPDPDDDPDDDRGGAPLTREAEPQTDEEAWRSWARDLQEPWEGRFRAAHLGLARRQQDAVLQAFDEQMEDLEDRIQEEVAEGRFEEAVRRRAYRDASLIESILFDLSEESATWAAGVRPLVQRMMAEGGGNAFAQAGVNISFNVSNPAVQASIQNQAFSAYASKVNANTLTALRNTLSEGFAAGDSIEALRERIRGVYTDLSANRAQMAARTESVTALNAGASHAIDQARDQGIELEKVWLPSLDGRERETHADANGQVADADDGTFNIGGHQAEYPGDPSLPPEERIQCRCAIRARRKASSDDES